MITYYNHLHALHQGKLEMFRGELVPCFEVPARADYVLKELERRQLGPVQAPLAFDDAALAGIHTPRYLDFLANAWD
jgi:acetoin utilization deacetylase AcuC-like enzyme